MLQEPDDDDGNEDDVRQCEGDENPAFQFPPDELEQPEKAPQTPPKPTKTNNDDADDKPLLLKKPSSAQTQVAMSAERKGRLGSAAD
eukprot:3366129-Alexandrium_andersonii.AAC.1